MYHRSRSPARFSEGRSLSGYNRGLASLNSFNADLALSSYNPRNRSVQRVIDSDFARTERSRSPVRDYSSSVTLAQSFRPLPLTLSGDTSPVLRRREIGLTSSSISDSRSSPVNWLAGDDYKIPSKPRSYYDFPSVSSARYNSYSSTSIRRPQRTDYSDYFRPVLTSRPALKSNYTPRPRAERENAAMPIVRERKLIKFRETSNDILGKTKRKISWDLTEEIFSPLINEMRDADGSTSEKAAAESIMSRDNNVGRFDSKEESPRDRSLTRYDSKESHSRDGSLSNVSNRRDSGSSTTSASRRSSDHSIDRMSPRNLMRLKSPRKSNHLDPNDPIIHGLSEDPKTPPLPRKKSIGSLPKSKHRKSSIEILTSDEKRLKHSIIADKIRRSQESPENANSLTDNLSIKQSDVPVCETSMIDKCESENSYQVDRTIPDVISETPDQRSRRRRRGYVSDTQTESEETARSRCRSRVRSELELASYPKNTLGSSDISEATRSINRMHRKSVKYKAEQPTQVLKDSTYAKESVTLAVDSAIDSMQELRKINVPNLPLNSVPIDLKHKQSKTPTEASCNIDNEALQIKNEDKLKLSKESNRVEESVDQKATDKTLVDSKEQASDITSSKLNQIKDKKNNKDGLKGAKGNKMKVLEANSADVKKLVDPTRSLDIPNKTPLHDTNVTVSDDQNTTAKQQFENNSKLIKDHKFNSKCDKIDKFPDADSTKVDSKHTLNLEDKHSSTNITNNSIAPSVMSNVKDQELSIKSNLDSNSKVGDTYDKSIISGSKNLDTKLQSSSKNVYNDKSKKFICSANTDVDIKTKSMVSSKNKTSTENNCLAAELNLDSKSSGKISAIAEKKVSSLYRDTPSTLPGKLSGTNTAKDTTVANSGVEYKDKISSSINSELKVDTKKCEIKSCDVKDIDSKKQDLPPSLTTRQKAELEANSKIQSSDVSNIKINQFNKTDTRTQLKRNSNIEETKTSQSVSSDLKANFGKKSSPNTIEKHTSNSFVDKPLHTNNVDMQMIPTDNKISISASLENKTYLPQNTKLQDSDSQINFERSPDVLTDKNCSPDPINKSLDETKSLGIKTRKAKLISDSKESVETQPKLNLAGDRQLNTKQVTNIKDRQLDRTTSTPDVVQQSSKSMKTKPVSEIIEKKQTSASQNIVTEQEEIVIVCKLPPRPKIETHIKHSLPDNIPIDQNLIVSLRKSTKLHVLGKHFDPIGNKLRAQPVIPNHHEYPVQKEVSKSKIRALTSVNEEPEVNISALSKDIDHNLNATAQNKSVNSQLKPMPDVIQSAIKTSNQTSIAESNLSITVGSVNLQKEQSPVLPIIKKDSSVSGLINQKFSVDLNKPDIKKAMRTTEDPLNKLNAANKESIISDKATEPQPKGKLTSSERLEMPNDKKEFVEKLPILQNNKHNSTCVTKLDTSASKTISYNKETNFKNIKTETKIERDLSSLHESEKKLSENASAVKASQSLCEKIPSGLTKPDILKVTGVIEVLPSKSYLADKKSLDENITEKSKPIIKNSNTRLDEQQTKSTISNAKLMEQQIKPGVLNSYAKLKEQPDNSNNLNLGAKFVEQAKQKGLNSDEKLAEQHAQPKDLNLDVKLTGKQTKLTVLNSTAKLSEQQTKSEVLNLDVKVTEQAKSKVLNLDVKPVEQQTKSKVSNFDAKLTQQQEAKTKDINSDTKLKEQSANSKNLNLGSKFVEQAKPKDLNSDVKLGEQQARSKGNSDVKLTEQKTTKVLNSDIKLAEQQAQPKDSNLDVKLTGQQTKSTVLNSNAKLSEQQTKSEVLNLDVKVTEQAKSKVLNLDVIKPVEQQTKSKVSNFDAKLTQQQAKTEDINSDSKLKEQSANSKNLNLGSKFVEQAKPKDLNSEIKLGEKQARSKGNSDIKLTEQQTTSNVLNSDVKRVEQQAKLNDLKSDKKLSEQAAKSMVLNSDLKNSQQSKVLKSEKLDIKETNVDTVILASKGKELVKDKTDVAKNTFKPSVESSKPYKRSVTDPNVDTLLQEYSGAPTHTGNFRGETKSVSSTTTSSKVFKDKISPALGTKTIHDKDEMTSTSKEKVLHKYTSNSVSLDKTIDKKNIPGSTSQQLANKFDTQIKNTPYSPITGESDSLNIKDSCRNSTLENSKNNCPISKVAVKDTELMVEKVASKGIKEEFSKLPASKEKEVKTSEAGKDINVDNKLSPVKKSPLNNKLLQSNAFSKLNLDDKTTTKSKCDEKDKSIKEDAQISTFESLKSVETCLKVDETSKGKITKADKSMILPNLPTDNSPSSKLDRLSKDKTDLNVAINAQEFKAGLSNVPESVNAVPKNSRNEMSKTSVLPKKKSSKSKQNTHKDVNGNSPEASQILNGLDHSSISENKKLDDSKSSNEQNQVAKLVATNSNEDKNQSKTFATISEPTNTENTPKNNSLLNQNVAKTEASKPTITSATDTIRTEVSKDSEPKSKLAKTKAPPAPAPRQFGLCFRYHEPIRKSSSYDSDSSDSESSTSYSSASETETTSGNARYREEVSRTLLDNECNVACHQKCEKLMPNLCGVNQKLLSEILETVKKGKPISGNQERVRSQLSDASVTTTTFSLYDDSPKTVPIVPPKLKFRQYSIDDFVFLKLLGKGSFGKVLLAELKGHGMHFAIKCLKKDVVLEDDDVESTMIERKILRLGTQHPYMCKLYCTFQTESYLFFVMEYLNGGDLMFHIQQRSPFEVKRAMFYGAEIVSALKFLHKRGIIYRDIKLDNVLLDSEGHVHLTDFGMCKTEMLGEKTTTFCGTPDYLPPEIILGKMYNQSVDWWSFGILLFEMLVGRSPFVGTDEDELFWSVCNEEPCYPRILPSDAKHILENLLIKTPNDRLGMPSSAAGNIEDHPFFSTINWDLLEKKQIPPPFKPTVLSASDTRNFDRSFTMDSPTLSPIENDILASMDQEQFQGFSYTNPHITG